ncbi:coiled-coil domain-containing protein 149-B isoform X4 [Magallana gigas]|uniref:coiled-coil domain-containing protein 149-B isoform X4 n=1 Tax=Magallana gigas TaxID=29159 RepID=UPI00333F5011
MTRFRQTEDDLYNLESKFDSLRNEYLVCKRKLESKCQALLILTKEMGQCRSERDQFKLMAEQLRERYQGLKKQLHGQIPKNFDDSKGGLHRLGEVPLQALLVESREQTKCLQFEVDDLKQKLQDAWGDIKLLREQIARQRVGTTDEGINTRHFPAHERESLVKQLEDFRVQYTQLERDLQQVLDEKQEQETERDAYKTKYERLNQELNYILKGDERRVVDLDALIMENKYLQERLKQMEEEKSIAMATVSKYKTLLERRKMKSALKLGQSRSGGLIISQKQVQQFLEDKSECSVTPQTVADIKALAGALLDTVNDKNLALSHQRKTNKILGNRISELEKKIKTLEVAGLWNISTSTNLEKLKEECEEVKTLIPQLSQSSEDGVNGNSTPGSSGSSLNSSPQHSSSTPCCVSPSHYTEGSGKSSPLDSLYDSSGKISPRDESSELSLCDTSSVPLSQKSDTSGISHHSDITNDEIYSLTSPDSSTRQISPQSSPNEAIHSNNMASPSLSPKGNTESLDTDDLDLIPEKESSTTNSRHDIGENLLENAETDELLTVSESEDGKLSVEMDDTEEQMNLLMETMTNKMLSVNQKLKVKDTVPSDVCVQSDQEDGEGSSDRPLLGNNDPPRDDLNVEC